MTDQATDIQIAQVTHAALSAWAEANGEAGYPDWSSAPDWMRASSLESVRFTIENPAAPPSAQHDQWMDQKRRDGWRYGPEKNEAAKTHPLLVPYAELPDYEKRKDALLRAVILALGPIGLKE